MVVLRASAATRALGRTAMRRAGTQSRPQAWRQLGRRQYATEHAKKSSDLPWLIGSVALTAPAAVWLFGQGPKGGSHHAEHAHEEKEEEEEAPEKEESSEDAPAEDSKDEEKEESKSDEGEDKSEAKSEEKSEDKDEGDSEKKDDSSDAESKDSAKKSSEKGEGGEAKPERQINYKPGMGKGPGEGQRPGAPRPTEKKGEKDAQGDTSGANHPYMNDDEKSKKGLGITETAKVHGTVDTSQHNTR